MSVLKTPLSRELSKVYDGSGNLKFRINLNDSGAAEDVDRLIEFVNGYTDQSTRIAELEAELAAKDDPEFDCTDAAHPAWWRGHEHTTIMFCQHVNEILDGKECCGQCTEPWESTRQRLHNLRTQLAARDAKIAELAGALKVARNALITAIKESELDSLKSVYKDALDALVAAEGGV